MMAMDEGAEGGQKMVWLQWKCGEADIWNFHQVVGVFGEHAMKLIDSGVELWDLRQLMSDEKVGGRVPDVRARQRKCFMGLVEIKTK